MTAWVRRGLDQLVQLAVPFLQEGLAAGDAVVLGCEARKDWLLADALGRGPRVGLLERSRTYRRVPVAVAAYRRMVEHQLATGARRVRLVGEVDFGQDPASWSEWIRYESVVNVALAPYPSWSVCAYDTGTLPEPVLNAGHRTRPDPLEATDPTVVAGDLTDTMQLAALRQHLHDQLVRAVVPDPARSDFVGAVSEVAANGILHGARRSRSGSGRRWAGWSRP